MDTKQLKRQVKRNKDRFPADFMFELNAKEFKEWRRQFGTSNNIQAVFAQLKQFLIPVEQAERRWIGFRRKDEKD